MTALPIYYNIEDNRFYYFKDKKYHLLPLNFGAGRSFGGGGGGISGLVIEDEGSALPGKYKILNFIGTAVSATDAGGGQANITIMSGMAPTYGTYTAFAAGGQGGATQLSDDKNLVNVAAANNASVKLVSATVDVTQVVQNRAGNGNSINVYPAVGDAFDGMAINAPFSLADGNDLVVNCYVGGTWVF